MKAEKNRQLVEKVEKLEREYKKVRGGLEFIMSIVESMDTKELKRSMVEKRKKELTAPTEPPPR